MIQALATHAAGRSGTNVARLFRYLFVLLLLAAPFAGCRNGADGPDVSGIQVDLRTRRLDLDMRSLDTTRLAAGLQGLKAKYPDFLDFYLDTVLGYQVFGNYSDTAAGIREALHTFLTHPDYRGLFDTVARHFPDTKGIDRDLTEGFRHMKYYFPQFRVPSVVYFVSGLTDLRATLPGTDGVVGVGLDMYLGQGYPNYASVGIPAYMTYQLRPEYAAVNVFRLLYQNDHPFITEGRNLLDLMIQRGKEQYFLSHILPSVPDSTRLGFRQPQMDWCNDNEALIYNFFMKDNLLYETNWQKILRYVNEGPSSAGMPAESPGNVGTWLGWQIVQAYMKQHPGMKLEELFAMQDPQTILREAKYKPR